MQTTPARTEPVIDRAIHAAEERIVPVLILSAAAVGVCVAIATCASILAVAWKILRWAALS